MQKYFIFIIFILFVFFKGYSQQNELKDIKIGVKHTPPFIIKNGNNYSGISIDLWQKIADSMGVSYTYQEYDLAGLIQSLDTSGIDLCISPLTVTANRMLKFDFTQPFYISNLAIASKKEEKSQIIEIFKNLLSYEFFEAILYLFLVILGFGLLLWLVETYHNPKQFGTGLRGIGHGIWWSAVTMTTVGYGDKAPTTILGRLIAIVWMFTAIIIISSFTGSISSSLTVEQLNSKISSIDDLKQMRVATVKSSSSGLFLQKKNINFSEYNTIIECLKSLYDNKIDAVVYDEPILQYTLYNEKMYDKITVLPYKFNTQYYSFSLPLGKDAFKKKMNYLILKNLETEDWKLILNKYQISQD